MHAITKYIDLALQMLNGELAHTPQNLRVVELAGKLARLQIKVLKGELTEEEAQEEAEVLALKEYDKRLKETANLWKLI